MTTIRPADLIVRCYAENKGNHWEAFCLDFTLAAQGETFDEVKDKLIAQISEYVYDALAGEDQDFAVQFSSRKAPAGFWLKYYYLNFLNQFFSLDAGNFKLFETLLPVKPTMISLASNKAG